MGFTQVELNNSEDILESVGSQLDENATAFEECTWKTGKKRATDVATSGELQGVGFSTFQRNEIAVNVEIKSVDFKLEVNKHVTEADHKASVVFRERHCQHSAFLRVFTLLHQAVHIRDIRLLEGCFLG